MATIFIRRRPDSVMEWAIEDVTDWLKELKLEKYCKRFQSHLVTGPVILQMDDVLLDDLNITFGKERQLLLKESRKLCLQELDLVNKAIELKQDDTDSFSPSVSMISISSQDTVKDSKHRKVKTVVVREEFSIKKALTPQSKYMNSGASFSKLDMKKSFNQSCPDDPDEVATRATLMVTVLSQENTDLRSKLEESLQNEKQLKNGITNLRATNGNLQSKVQEYEIENRRLVAEMNELRRDYQNLNDSFKQRENNITETLESEIEKLRQDNRLIRDKYQRFKFKAVEREMSRKSSNGSGFNRMNDSQSREPPRQNKDSNLQLIEKVYKANKRCAELEDTVRWLYAALRLENSEKKNHRKPTTDEDDRAPSEPDWPSLAGNIPLLNTVNSQGDTPDVEVLRHIVKRGLPTDSDEDIWTKRVTNQATSGPKDLDRQDGPHHWNV